MFYSLCSRCTIYRGQWFSPPCMVFSAASLAHSTQLPDGQLCCRRNIVSHTFSAFYPVYRLALKHCESRILPGSVDWNFKKVKTNFTLEIATFRIFSETFSFFYRNFPVSLTVSIRLLYTIDHSTMTY